MAFSLERVVPWGRTASEYERIFDLRDEHLNARILGCGDGPASFNAEWSLNIQNAQRRGSIISCDPIYNFEASEIARRFEEVYPVVLEQTRRNRDSFVWNEFASVEDLGRQRRDAFEKFLRDYQTHRSRYVAAQLPQLPFADCAFDLALCSHFLFLYSEHLNLDFHLQALRELLRVAREVRVFPLLALDAKLSPHLEPVLEQLQCEYSIELIRVPYEFQRGGHTMLRLRHRKI